MRTRHAVLLLVACAGTVQGDAPASGGFADAATLRTWCLGAGTVRATCIGYLAGVVDGLPHPRRPPSPCLPPKLQVEQVRLLFLNHMHRHPHQAGRGAATQVRAALAHAFPCDPPPRAPKRPGENGVEAVRSALETRSVRHPAPMLRSSRSCSTRRNAERPILADGAACLAEGPQPPVSVWDFVDTTSRKACSTRCRACS